VSAGFPSEAIPHLREAVRLNPSHAGAHAFLAFAFNFLDRPDDALPEIELALRLSPHEPRRFLWLPALAISHYLAGRYRDALAACQEALAAKPEYPVAIRYLTATLGQLGRRTEAQTVIPLLRRLDSNLAGTEAYMRRIYAASAVRRILEGLSKAGFD
jgi:adenylate cyclase